LVDAYINGNLYVNITRKYGQKYGTFTYLHVLDPEDLPLTKQEFEGFQEGNGDRMVM
jgi:hypothetical protein